MISNGWKRKVKEAGFTGEIRHKVPMSEVTSFKIGGPADCIL
jgi:hypothetical protein